MKWFSTLVQVMWLGNLMTFRWISRCYHGGVTGAKNHTASLSSDCSNVILYMPSRKERTNGGNEC